MRLSINDAGTGHSSLSFPYRFPVDLIQSDKRYVQNLEKDQAGHALTKAIMHIGASMPLTVVVEAVEKEAQSDFLNV